MARRASVRQVSPTSTSMSVTNSNTATTKFPDPGLVVLDTESGGPTSLTVISSRLYVLSGFVLSAAVCGVHYLGMIAVEFRF